MANQRFQHGDTPDGEHLKMQAKQVFDAVLKMAGQARDTAGQLVHDNRGKIDSVLDKAAHLVDDRTGRKYASTIAKVKAGAAKGVDLVEGGHAAGTPGAASSGPAPSSSASGDGSGPTTTVPGATGPAASWPTGPGAGVPGAGSGSAAPGAPGEPAAGWRRDDQGDWVRDDRA